MDNSEEFILVGKVSGAFGIQGWVKIFSFTEPRKNILAYSPLYISRKGQWVKLDVVSGRVQGKGIVMSLEGITDPDQVLPLVGSELAITKEQLKPTENDEFYWSQLIGLTVINVKDETLGIVERLHETGANDVLIVKNKEQKTEHLVPFVMEEVVQLVDLDKQIIRVDWELDY